MYTPLRVEYGVPVFSIADIEQYGSPEEVHRIWQYQVVEISNHQEYVLDYRMSQDHCISTLKTFGLKGRFGKPVHIYKRMDRFTKTMNNLLGYTSPPEEIIEIVFDNLIEQDPNHIWESVEKILVKNKLSKYVEKIPWLLKTLGFPFITSKHNPFDITAAFEQMSTKFDLLPKTDRTYFPKMRYVCIRLLSEMGVEFGYHIPVVKTASRLVILNDLFNKLRN